MRAQTHSGEPLVAGTNKDHVDIDAGLKELVACGYTAEQTCMVIEYNLRRWGRGEEEQAQRGAIDKTFYGVSATCWVRILAAAIASGNAKASGLSVV